MSTDPRTQHVEHITKVLHNEFPTGIDPDVLDREVETVYDGIAASSRVEPFVPILALRHARERIELLVADGTAVAGFVQPGTEPRYQPGDIANLVDGRFQVTRLEPTHGAIRYVGHWLEPV